MKNYSLHLRPLEFAGEGNCWAPRVDDLILWESFPVQKRGNPPFPSVPRFHPAAIKLLIGRPHKINRLPIIDEDRPSGEESIHCAHTPAAGNFFDGRTARGHGPSVGGIGPTMARKTRWALRPANRHREPKPQKRIPCVGAGRRQISQANFLPGTRVKGVSAGTNHAHTAAFCARHSRLITARR